MLLASSGESFLRIRSRKKEDLGGGKKMSAASVIIVGVTFISLAFCLIYSFKDKTK